MRAQPFLIPIVLMVAFIAVVGLLNWVPSDGKSDGASGLCEPGMRTSVDQGEYPLRENEGDANVVKQVTLQPCELILFRNNPQHGESCVYVSKTGQGWWHKVPYANNLVVSYVVSKKGIFQVESPVEYNSSVRWWDTYYVTASEPVLIDAFGIAKGAGFSCPTDYRR